MHIPLQVKPSPSTGFTLIEMSIVLIVIGLLVGGILTGQDLINAAAQSAQVAQITKYNTAVNTFRNKYGGLPGDLPDPMATQFGFQPRGQFGGEGDGNGILQGNCGNLVNKQDDFTMCGELAVFWEDLSEASLIDTTVFGHDTKGNGHPWATGPGNIVINLTTTPGIKDQFPTAKVGTNNFVYLYSFSGINYFAVSSVTTCCNDDIISTANPGLTVQQAYNIDSKIDDGLPQSGSVTACYINYNVKNYYAVWAAGSLAEGAHNGLITDGNGNHSDCVPTTTATVPAATDCYGNNNSAGTMKYSIGSNANLQNCALSFKFQ